MGQWQCPFSYVAVCLNHRSTLITVGPTTALGDTCFEPLQVVCKTEWTGKFAKPDGSGF